MRIRLLLAALAALVPLAAASPASAVTCSYPSSAYSTGGPPGSGPVNDPLFPRQWGLDAIHAPAAWQHGYRGAGATIAIVDTGVDLSHPDLQANIVAGVDLDPGSAGDATTPATPKGGECPGPQDENGHGTHVAGIAAAVTGNGIGGAGTAPDARIMPVRVLDASGSGDDQTVIDGIHWAADHGARVINMSLGGQPIIGETPQLNQALADAVEYAFAKGAVTVAAAGNESIPLCSYPAATQHAVCVGATDKRNLPTFYSNFPNSPDGNVGVRAPGGLGTPFCEQDEDIWSTIWPGSADDCQGAGSLTGYDTLAGTSMATPYVSGVAAMLAAKGLSAAQILECLRTTSSNKGSYDPVMGYGLVDADSATSTCSPQTTAAFQAPSGAARSAPGGSGSRSFLVVKVKRTTLKALRRTRTLTVLIRSSRKVTVSLRAVGRRGHSPAKALSRRTARLGRAGTRTFKMRISRRSARALLRKGTTVRVLYRAGAIAGVAGRY